MPLERLSATASDAGRAAAALRALVPAPASVSAAVAEILAAVRDGGDPALLALEARFGGGGAPLRVTPAELEAALAGLPADVRAGLETARANIDAVARAGLTAGEPEVELPQGHRVRLREVPVRSAAVYAPGGRAPYPSSVLMGAVTARAAGVEQLVVAAPPHPVILAAAALCGADAVYRMGGAQAIAALAYGTESVTPVDVVVGPGNLYVQEAKRQLSGVVGIDGFAGPSDLVIIATAGADPRWVALDLLAQAEHGEDTVVAAISDDEDLLDAIGAELAAVPAVGSAEPRRGSTGVPAAEARGAAATAALVAVDSADTALAVAEAFAPEHLELAGEAAEALAPRVRSAGCLLVGAASATAFADYVAGSNHTLPTAGAARFASGLSVRHFRRRMAEVRIDGAAGALARAGAPVARAEGFLVHAESMEARVP